jgi:hypothetical protein
MRSIEESIKVTDTQLERIKNYNSTRVTNGRFLFGHGIVDEGRGGIFILDVSAAQPHSSADFMVQQLCQMFDFWCGAWSLFALENKRCAARTLCTSHLLIHAEVLQAAHQDYCSLAPGALSV